MAAICGIDVRKIRMLTFGMAAAMAGAAGVMLSVIYSFWPGSGVDFIQKCFAIIIIGGMGNFLGALYGGILLGVVEAFVGGFAAGLVKFKKNVFEAAHFANAVAALAVTQHGTAESMPTAREISRFLRRRDHA